MHPNYEHIRTVEFPAEGIRLDLWDTFRTDKRGKSYLAYTLRHRGRLIFAGEEFSPSPMHADDSDKTAGALLGFLSCRPGDTDEEFFADYAPSQLAWAEENGELLSILAEKLESSDT